ncbi:MAG: 16S rRNA (cytosine(1402)-N(4))-methyltransferase RsmH [Planctomycetota bacterium]
MRLGVEHRAVLLEEVLHFLAGVEPRILLDATVGQAGHTRAVLEAFPEVRVIGMDRDADMLTEAQARLDEHGARVRLHHAAFADLAEVLERERVTRVDAVLFDLGVASPQLDRPERGFSFRHDGPLDMRMDRTRETTAADLIRRLPEKELGNLIHELGGERAARRVAAAIVAERRREPIRTTLRLAEIVRRAVRGRGRIDAATRTFQALRMAVNDELGQLEGGLEAATDRVRFGGRILAIAFHSGEDRIVKNFFRADERLDVLTKKVVRPGAREARDNPRARSARLRVAERRRSDAA